MLPFLWLHMKPRVLYLFVLSVPEGMAIEIIDIKVVILKNHYCSDNLKQ